MKFCIGGTGYINSFIIDTELFDVVEDGTQNIAVLCRCHHTKTVGHMIDVLYDGMLVGLTGGALMGAHSHCYV